LIEPRINVAANAGNLVLDIRDAAGAADMDIVRTLLREYQSTLDTDLCFQGFNTELANLPGDYQAPQGRLYLAFYDDQPIGCIALRAVDDGRGEMKRLFVRPAARGLGAGLALVARLLADAKAIGYREIVLDTLPSMNDAQRMYERLGFRDIAPYCVNPVAGARYLALSLPRT